MNEKILLVDDDPNILSAFRRQLRKTFDIHLAEGGSAALHELNQTGPYALVVSDMQMPDVNGLELLCHIREEYPDTVRIMLTGNADQRTAVDAVNQGNIFRFLNKPCAAEDLSLAIAAGLDQHRLIVAERQLLSETLNGSIELLNDVLGMTNPTAFGRANRLRTIVKKLSEHVPQSSRWQLEVAAGLSQIGWVTIPHDVIEKRTRGQQLGDQELAMISAIPGFSSQFVQRIPRLEPVSQIIELQGRLASGDEDVLADDDLLKCARLLDLILTYDEVSERFAANEALETIRNMERFREDSDLLDQLQLAAESRSGPTNVTLDKLRENMVLEQDIVTTNGTLIVRAGQVITDSLIVRLKNYDSNQGIAQPIRVQVR